MPDVVAISYGEVYEVKNPASFVNCEVLIVDVAIVVTEALSFATTNEPGVHGVDDDSPEPPTTVKSPEPRIDEPLIVLMFVPDMRGAWYVPKSDTCDLVIDNAGRDDKSLCVVVEYQSER